MASPMWQYAAERGYPTDWHVMNLGRLADGGSGLVCQEGTLIERRGCGSEGDLGIWNDDYIPHMKRLAGIIRMNGAVPAIQLMHTGRKAKQQAPFKGRSPITEADNVPDWDSWDVIAPSAIAVKEGFVVPREMTAGDIADVLRAFADATRRSREAGYDVIELHGAHGYLIHQFLSPHSNRRSDKYGGSFENRTRFCKEVVEAVRSEWPEDKPLFMRLSCVDGVGWEITDSIELVRQLAPMGVDLIDCSSGGLAGSPLPPGKAATYGYQVPYAKQIREETGVPTAAVGLIVHPDHAESIIANGEADMVAIGRELIYNPNWPIDAAQKLGAEQNFALAGKRTAFWLDRRVASTPNFVPSTFTERK